MTRNGLWSLVVVLGAVNAGCAYNRPIPESPLAVPEGPQAPLTEKWLLRANRGMTLPMAVHEGSLYGVGIDRRVVAIDLAKGELRWAYRMDGPGSAGVLIRNDTIISASERPGGVVFAVTAATGRYEWKRRVGWVGAPLALAHDVLVVQTQLRGTYGIEPVEGEVLWQLPIMGGRTSALATGGGELLVASLDSMYRIDAKKGTVTLRRATPGPVMVDWEPTGQGVLLATGRGEVAMVSPADLTVRWRAPLDDAVIVPLAVVGDTAWAVTRRNTIWRVDLVTGTATRLFVHPTPVTAPVTTWDGSLLIGDALGVLTAYAPDQSVRWRLAVGRPVEVAPIEYEGDLIVIGGRGDVHRFGRR
jgi:outer membrane protein assembly factor BamB